MLRRLNGVGAIIVDGIYFGIETIAKANDETVEIIVRDYRSCLTNRYRFRPEQVEEDVNMLRESIRRVRQGLDPCWR